MKLGQISKALIQWTTGDEYKEILRTLEEINEDSSETQQILQKTQNSVTRDIKRVNDKQQRIQQHVLDQQSLLNGLKNLLRTNGEEEK